MHNAVQFNVSSAKFLLMISIDIGTFVFILLFIGFNVETDVGINESSVPIRIFGMHFVLRAFKAQILCSSIHLFFCEGSKMTDFEVDESTVLDWLYTTRCL